MARATIAQQTKLGIETVYGTPVAASKRLPTLTIKPGPRNEAQAYRTQGNKFSSVVVPNKEWSEAAIDGDMTYGELVYIFCSVFASTTPAGGGAAKTWTMKPSNGSPDTPQSFTLEHGDPSFGIRSAGHVVTDVTLDINRQDAKLTGKTIGLPFVTPFTLTTAGVTMVENVPITPGSISMFLDPTFAALGTTKLNKPLSAQLQLTGRWVPEWVLDASQPSYIQIVEGAPTAKVMLKLEADAQAMALFAAYRAGSLIFLRVQATGPSISGATVTGTTVTTPGSGYTSAPTVAFSGGGGTGAAGTAVLGSGGTAGQVVSVTITNPGSGYTSAPTMAFSGGGGSGAGATATISGGVNYSMLLDIPLEVHTLQDYSDEGGAYCIAFELEPIADPGTRADGSTGANYPMQLTVVNQVASL